MVEDHLYFITVADNLRHFPVVTLIAKLLSPFLNGIRRKHTGYTRDKVARRIGSSLARKDFMANLIGKVESNEMDLEELTAHASTLVNAGGETVATFLAAATFSLLRNDAVYQKLKAEIRGQFKTYAEITCVTAQTLPYLQAVMKIVNKSMDWESESSLHVMWSKPDLKVRFRQARGQ
ncbi:hypothetical protein BDV23DRAFT_178178 [Aspergillus alliaceus]|uniref:Cytochrome P450 n=1 Tax=Petromyces alliaceus TaxID=209559 RepID=A0A5N7CQD5_PETAA|nr:hypothetical protein BDV23DRAFT_178178 [Aspergillus alliaceus]